ncbi:class I SAM-dependent methyltransferase [Mariniblastus sp.]|nr:class I SAM-dependent methyltransferase [Mariniblastus sp.]
MVDLIAELYEWAIPEFCEGSLLDLGCGHAPLYLRYRDYVSEITCIDWAESMHQNQLLDIVHDLNEPFPLPDNQFDSVICSDVLEHIFNPKNIWDETFRTLKPGGTLMLNVPFYYWLHEAPFDFHRYTEFALTRYAEAAGFTDIKLFAVGGKQNILADLLSRSAHRLPLTSFWIKLIQLLIAPSAKKTIAKSFTEDGLNRFPLLYFMVVQKPN